MELHPALAFGAALGGAAVLGAVGAVLALPAAAMGQAIVQRLGRPPPGHQERPHRGPPPPGVEAVVEDPQGPRVSSTCRRPPFVAGRRHRRAAASTRASTTAPSSPSTATARSPGRPATRTSRSTPARRSSRCRRRRWWPPVSTLDDRCWPSSAPATTGAPSTSPRSREILAGAGLDEGDLREHADAAARRRRHARRRAGRRAVRRRSSRTAAASMPGCWRRRSSTGGRPPGTSPPTTRCSGMILDDLARDHGRGATTSGVDGCGAPAAVVPLAGLARGRARARRRRASRCTGR